MGKQATLTRHAISPPEFEGSKIHRERLVDALHANIPRRLIAVIAPAGYGKTTVLADFAAHTDLPVCWLRLTEGDRDPMRMAGVLEASLAHRFRRIRRTLRVAAMGGADETAAATAFVHAIRVSVDEPFVLIVDDIHLVNESPSAMQFWKVFLQQQPEQLTLVMAGREVPNVPIEGLLEQGQVAGLGPLELALTREELHELARRALGRELGDGDLERLLRETGGWVMGVLLSGAVPVSGLGVLVQSQRPMVYDYLAAVVLNRQPGALREFLLRSAVLPVMTAEACDEVLERRDSGRVLLQALRGGMFLSSTGERPKTYEYHPQFREFLLATLQEEDAAALRRLRVRAAGHLTRQGSIEAAVDLYLEAGDTRRAGRLAEKHARAIRRAGKLETLERWRERLEGEERVKAGLDIQLGVGLADRGYLSGAEERFLRAERSSRLLSNAGLRAHANLGLAQVACLAGNYRRGLVSANRALSLAEREAYSFRPDAMRFKSIALSLLDWRDRRAYELMESALALERGRRKRDPYGLTIFQIDLAEIATRAGLESKAIRAHRAVSEAPDGEMVSGLRGNVMLSHALVHVFEGRLTDALHLAEAGARAARAVGNPRIILALVWLQAILLAAAQQDDRALRLLGEVDAENSNGVNQWLRWGILMLRSDIFRWQGHYSDARDEIDRWRPLLPGSDLPPWVATRAMAVEERGDPAAVASLLSRHLQRQRRMYEPDDLALSYWLIARSNWSAGSREKFRRYFMMALDTAFSPLVQFRLSVEVLRSAPAPRQMFEEIGGVARGTKLLAYIDQFRRLAHELKTSIRSSHPPGVLSVRALAPAVEVALDGAPIRLRPLDAELLVLLAEGDRESRESICEALWPGRTMVLQAANLHSAIYRVRKRLGDGVIVTSGLGYAIADDIAVKYDAVEFVDVSTRLKAMGESSIEVRLELLRDAVTLYGEGFISRRDAPWIVTKRASLERIFLSLLEEYATACLVTDRLDDLDKHLDYGLALDPYSDGLNVARFETLARKGRWQHLSAAYAKYVQDLRQDLGIDPPKTVRETYSSLISETAK